MVTMNYNDFAAFCVDENSWALGLAFFRFRLPTAPQPLPAP